MLPGKTLWITIGSGYDRNENDVFQLTFEAFIYKIGIEQSIMGNFIIIDGDLLFKGGGSILKEVFL